MAANAMALCAGYAACTCVNCEEKISEADSLSSHVLKDHCMQCSKRSRSILSNCTDPKIATWFQGLRKSNLPEYRRIMKDHSDAMPQMGRGLRTKWDLLEYFETQEAKKAQKTAAGFKAMDWNKYSQYFMSEERGADQLTEDECLRAWLRDVSGCNGSEPFKAKVLNRKTGETEERQCVCVQLDLTREKYEEESTKKSVKLTQRSNNPNEAQVKEAQLKVASFVTHECDSDFLTSAKLCNFQAEFTDFTLLGSGNSTAAKAKAKKRGSGSGKSTKLIDVTQMRAKFVVKVNSVAVTAETHLKESLNFYQKYCESEADLIANFKSCLDNGATVENILKSELAGDEAGMMKCLFIVETRALSCKALSSQSFDQLADFLVDNEIPMGSVEGETRQVDVLTEAMSSLMSSDAFLKENVVKEINVNLIPSLVKAEALFEDCDMKEKCQERHKAVETSLKACQKVATALRRAVHDMKKMRTALTKLQNSKKNKQNKDDQEGKIARSLTGRTSIAKAVSMNDPMLLQCIKDVIQHREIRMVKDPAAELVNGVPDAARPFCIRKGRNIMKHLVKSDDARAVLERTINSFRDKLLSGGNDKAVIIINKDDDGGLTKAITDSLSSILPESWAQAGGGEILPDGKEMDDVLNDNPDLKPAHEQLTSVWISGRKVDSVYSGLESQGLCTLHAQVSGGRIMVLAAVDELLSFFPSANKCLKTALDMFGKLHSKDLPDNFAMPSLCAVYLRTGDILFCPCGYVAVEKGIQDTSVAVRIIRSVFTPATAASFLAAMKQVASRPETLLTTKLIEFFWPGALEEDPDASLDGFSKAIEGDLDEETSNLFQPALPAPMVPDPSPVPRLPDAVAQTPNAESKAADQGQPSVPAQIGETLEVQDDSNAKNAETAESGTEKPPVDADATVDAVEEATKVDTARDSADGSEDKPTINEPTASALTTPADADPSDENQPTEISSTPLLQPKDDSAKPGQDDDAKSHGKGDEVEAPLFKKQRVDTGNTVENDHVDGEADQVSGDDGAGSESALENDDEKSIPDIEQEATCEPTPTKLARTKAAALAEMSDGKKKDSKEKKSKKEKKDKSRKNKKESKGNDDSKTHGGSKRKTSAADEKVQLAKAAVGTRNIADFIQRPLKR